VRRVYSGLFNIAILTLIMFAVPPSHFFQLNEMTYAHSELIYFNAAETFRLFDLGKPIHDSPSSISGFDQHEGIQFQVSFPSNWTKETLPLVKYTGLQSVPEVAFYVPSQNIEVTISTDKPGNVSLPTYFFQEVDSLQGAVSGYVFIDSSESYLGNVSAKIVLYTSDMIEGGTIYGRMKTMELVSIHQGVSYFFVYRADESNFRTYLPVVQEMINSFVFKGNIE
jgi:hypothetical protein